MESLAEIRTLIAHHKGDHRLPSDMPELRLRHATAPTPPNNSVFDRAFVLVAQGKKRATLGDRVLHYGGGDFLLISVELPIVAQIIQATRSSPYLAFAMILRPATIASLLFEMKSAGHKPPPDPVGIAVSRAPSDLLDPIVRTLRLLDHPDDAPVLGPMLEREIVWRLLHGEQGWMVRQIGSAESSLAQISRAISWIRTHFADRFPIDEPARVAGMSPATFYRHFRAVTAMSPLQYQKHVRLQDARVRLLADHSDIASVGFAVGYESPSQFSREYSRLFGAPPGKDIERLRARPALAPMI
jgi:AraC-like DNA-binding protein